MPSSTSSSDPWRRFFRALLLTAAGGCALLFAFIAIVDPYDTLPLSPPFARWPIDSNARFAFPALARLARFDAALFGTSTSRLLKPSALNERLGAHLVNLSMNSATAYEQSRLMDVFLDAHPSPRAVLVGLDVEWCPTEGGLRQYTVRAFPEWMYGHSRWRAYAHLFDLHTIEVAGRAFAEFTGWHKQVYGGDGYTVFTPPDATYDAARAMAHIRQFETFSPGGRRAGPPDTWRFPALNLLKARLDRLPAATRKILFFPPYSFAALPKPGEADAIAVWAECKRRVAALAAAMPNTLALDFMRPSPITDEATNYWDGIHFREPIADRLVEDLVSGQPGDDGAVLRSKTPF